MTISQSQRHVIDGGFLDLMGESKQSFEVVKLDDLAGTMAYLGAQYAEEISKAMDRKDVSSSGKGQDSIAVLDVEIMGSVYSVAIEANKYLSFVNDGVDGWAKSVGGKFKFKTKGVMADSPMVRAIKAWLIREGKISRNMKYKAITKREGKQQSITDATTKASMRAAFMIKRQGIKPKGFFEDARAKMERLVEKELGIAVKVDIINNLS